MIGYAMLGTNDIPRAKAFYDPLMAIVGATLNAAYSTETRLWYGRRNDGLVVLTQPYDGQPASPGNGNMLALPVANRGQVNAVHAKALELGAANEGDPGIRGAPFYGAYFRDLEGHKFAVFCLTPD